MDELLKGYARKRRTDAGGSFELPPVARRLLQAEVSRLRAKRRPRPSGFSALLTLWPRIAYAVGLFAVLGFFVWFSLPARHKKTDQQLLAKGNQSEAEHRRLASKADAPLSSAEVLQAERGISDGKKESDELLSSRSGALDAVAEQRKVGKEISQTTEKSVLMAAEELKRKDEKPAIANEAPRPGFQKAEQQDATATVTLSRPPQAPAGPVSVRRAGADSSRSTPDPVAANGVLRDSSPAPAQTSANDGREKLAAFFTLGSFTNSYAVAVTTDLRARFAQASPRGQAIAFSESEALTNPRANQVARRPSPAFRLQGNQVAPGQTPDLSKNQAGMPAEAYSGTALHNRSAPQTQSSGGIATTPATRADPANKPSETVRSVGLANEQDVRGRHIQVEKAQATDEAKGLRVAFASVLNSFKLEQSGSRVRVLDFDGSMYEGTVIATESASDPSHSLSLETAVGLSVHQANTSPARPAASSDKERAERELSEVKVLSFRVAGTNTTFNLPVVLEGALWGKTGEQQENVSEPQDRLEPRLGRLREDGLQRNAPSVLRVRGRAQVGDTNQLSIDAIRWDK